MKDLFKDNRLEAGFDNQKISLLIKLFWQYFFINGDLQEITDYAEELIKILKANSKKLTITKEELSELNAIYLTDIEAAFNGDPAAEDMLEVILAYPGFKAVFIYRIANLLAKKDVKYLPRMMTEYAHSITGIDIHPKATIGKYFFIDHGTGTVIGETANIGDYVKIYQGVTLGALSTRGGQKIKNVKRHPTVLDNVTIYANASILGGETVIGEDAVIGANAFITKSVEPFAKISFKQNCPEEGKK
ncbi:MAG: hypothetical protein FWE36_06335 [Erysipelotrichales bacterium]|nr:hypothetical protein [Erysipelotrichales bacterium]